MLDHFTRPAAGATELPRIGTRQEPIKEAATWGAEDFTGKPAPSCSADSRGHSARLIAGSQAESSSRLPNTGDGRGGNQPDGGYALTDAAAGPTTATKECRDV